MSLLCRGCDSEALFDTLDMGDLPLAGDFRELGASCERYPLTIVGCESCGLLQVRENVASDLLFGPNYCYSSSTVPGLVRHFTAYARERASLPEAGRKKLLEVGCNDGVFLDPLRRAGYQVVGVDASDNVASMARENGLEALTGVFTPASARDIARRYGRFDIVTCSNVFAHNPAVNDFVQAVDSVLNPEEGEFWIEVQSAHHLFNGLQWDCFYHEHCFYWTIHSLRPCLERHGYKLRQYQMTSMHGGGIRAVFSKSGKAVEIEEEPLTPKHWIRFGDACRRSRQLINDSVKNLGLSYAYGAAGRAVVLINWAEIADRLDFVVDGSPLRFGKVIPNTNVPIISETEFFETPLSGDYCFVTAHNYLDDIKEKIESKFRGRFIKYVTPLPHVCIQ